MLFGAFVAGVFGTATMKSPVTAVRELSASRRKGASVIPGGETGAPSHIFRKQGVHIEVVADRLYCIKPSYYRAAVAGRRGLQNVLAPSKTG